MRVRMQAGIHGVLSQRLSRVRSAVQLWHRHEVLRLQAPETHDRKERVTPLGQKSTGSRRSAGALCY